MEYRKEILRISKSLCPDFVYPPDSFWSELYDSICRFDNQGYTEYFETDEQTVRSFSIHFTYNYVVDILSSGEYHCYAGQLGLEGMQVLKYYYALKDRLLIEGNEYDTPELLEENEKQMLINIKNAG